MFQDEAASRGQHAAVRRERAADDPHRVGAHEGRGARRRRGSWSPPVADAGPTSAADRGRSWRAAERLLGRRRHRVRGDRLFEARRRRADGERRGGRSRSGRRRAARTRPTTPSRSHGSAAPLYCTRNRNFVMPPGRRGAKRSCPSTARMPPNPPTIAVHVPASDARCRPSRLFCLRSWRSTSADSAEVVVREVEQTDLRRHDDCTDADNDESRTVSAS